MKSKLTASFHHPQGEQYSLPVRFPQLSIYSSQSLPLAVDHFASCITSCERQTLVESNAVISPSAITGVYYSRNEIFQESTHPAATVCFSHLINNRIAY
jgi:hypothetical protein